jgi:hypothetical protein
LLRLSWLQRMSHLHWFLEAKRVSSLCRFAAMAYGAILRMLRPHKNWVAVV